jgi:bifunctional non-homologous end joining protein LigD
MGLGKYFKKRNFKDTPEPKGAHKSTPSKRLAFVVQEHHASSLHYDFRLEIDGVLKSWAVPKGPSMDPHDHHLAIRTEDHPFEYRTFEGVIPEGNYGAGNVIIWDQGWYQARADNGKDSEKVLRKELKKGHVTFVVHGKKLKGEFALIKLHGPQADEKAWLLIKKGDEFATGGEITKQDESVVSHKRVDDLGAHNKLPDLTAYPKAAKPWQVKPMLCALVDEPFDRQDWLFEIKWDGYRAIGTKHKNEVQLYSRNAINFYDTYPPVAEAMRDFTHDVIVDGEIVVVDSNGAPHFEWLQSWRHDPQGELHYFIFDVLWCDGHDLRTMPLAERKEILKIVLPKNDVLRFSDHITTHGEKLFKEMQHRGLEGMVAKRADSPYRQGDRGADWLKIKTHMRQEVVIGGYTEPRGGRKYLGSLLVGVYEKGEFVYVGHSGGGIPDNQRKKLQQRLAKIELKTSPFNKEPKPNAPVHWVKPQLVCEMSFSEWTDDNYMRHPTFEGMRADKNPKFVRKEKPKHMDNAQQKSGGAEPELTHLDKIFFPKHKYTKGDLINYYTSVADYILPYLKDRPCSLNRMPNGITGESFYQKNNEHLPAWVPHADIFSESNNADLHWLVGGDLKTLHYMVQLGCIEINPWNSRVKNLGHPDWTIIDLDPDGVSFKKIIEVAHTVKEVCDEWKIPTYPKTSGKTGLHIFIPMGQKYTYEQARNFAHVIVLEVNKRQPKITSVERNPEHRRHKIYLDFLQNSAGQTLASPYSARPTPDASVSMPLHWDEVTPTLLPTDFTIKNAPARLKRVGDLWKPVLGKGVDLTSILKHIPTE